MKKILIISILTATTLLIAGCSANTQSKPDPNTNQTTDSEIEKPSTEKTDTTETDTTETEQEKPAKPKEEVITLTKKDGFSFTVATGNSELEFGTPWKPNSIGTEIALDGRGEYANEEGPAHIVLRTKNEPEAKHLNLVEPSQFKTPTYVEWINSNMFAMILGNKHGTISTGNSLFVVDTNNMNICEIYSAKETEEIIEIVKLSDNSINVKINTEQGQKEKNFSFKK